MSLTTYTIPGFQGHSSDHIDSPDIAELLFMPFFSRCDEDRFRKLGTDFQRELLDKTPLRSGYKYLVIDSYTQFLYPKACPVGTRSTVGELHEWHCDGFSRLGDEPSMFHLYQTNSDSTTMFNEHPIDIQLPKDMHIGDFNSSATRYAESVWGIKGVKMDKNKFITFTNHLHRSVEPVHKQFRFFFRVTQSNTIAPAYERSQPRMDNPSFIFGPDGKSTRIDNMIIQKDGITIKFEG